MSKFIDLTGLSRFLANCREIFYSKPEGGIPKEDLAGDVQTHLNELKAPLIIQGNFAGGAGDTFTPNQSMPSRSEAIAAIKAGRLVLFEYSGEGIFTSMVECDDSPGASQITIHYNGTARSYWT